MTIDHETRVSIRVGVPLEKQSIGMRFSRIASGHDSGLSVPKNLAFLIPEILARLAIAGRAKTLPVPPGR